MKVSRIRTSPTASKRHGMPDDFQRQQFFNDLAVRNIGMLEEMMNAFKDQNYMQTITDLLNFQPENLFEENMVKVYSRMEKVLSLGQITKEDTLRLDTISAQLAIEGGPAVYMARSILDEEFDDELTGSLLRESQNLIKESISKVRLMATGRNAWFISRKALMCD